jgi:hypothetical protein
MKPKFTPGPWELGDEAPLTIYAKDGYAVTGIADADESEGGRPEEDVANAHLIAAAPEMYEALDVAADIIHAAELHKTNPKAYAAIVEALKKARGDQ